MWSLVDPDAEGSPRRTVTPSAALRYLSATLRRHVIPQLAEPVEVGVRVEDDDSKRRLDQESLEDRSERIGLSRAGLAAQERVPVERTRIERERNLGRRGEDSDVEPGARRPRSVEPRGDLGGCSHAWRRIMEGRIAAGEDAAFDAREAAELRRGRDLGDLSEPSDPTHDRA